MHTMTVRLVITWQLRTCRRSQELSDEQITSPHTDPDHIRHCGTPVNDAAVVLKEGERRGAGRHSPDSNCGARPHSAGHYYRSRFVSQRPGCDYTEDYCAGEVILCESWKPSSPR